MTPLPRPDLSKLTESEKDGLILSLFDMIEALQRRIAELEARLSQPPKTPDNSSLPPSKGQKGDRAPGRKARRRGRPGVARELSPAPDRTVEAVAEHCPHCAAGLDAGDQRLVQVYDRIEIPPIRPVITRVHLYGGTCPCCRKGFAAPVEPGLEPGSPYGRSVVGLAVHLHYGQHIGLERLSRLFRDVFGLSISEGALVNLFRRSGPAFAAASERIKAQLLAAPIVASDETSTRVEGRTWWEWVFLGGAGALHVVDPSRAAAVPKALFGTVRPRVWISDMLGAQRGHADAWQVCLAHQLRDAQYAIDAGDAVFAPRLKRLLLRAIAIGRRRDRLKDSTLRQYRADLDRRLDRLMTLDPSERNGRRLRKRLGRHRAALFVFVTARDVPYTNNACERALRPSVIFRKVTNGFRSEWGAHLFADIRSVVTTGALDSLSPLQAIRGALACDPQPQAA